MAHLLGNGDDDDTNFDEFLAGRVESATRRWSIFIWVFQAKSMLLLSNTLGDMNDLSPERNIYRER